MLKQPTDWKGCAAAAPAAAATSAAAAAPAAAAPDAKQAAKDAKKKAKEDKKAAKEAAKEAAAPAADAAAAPAAAGAVNVQKFTGALGGAAPPVEFTQGADRPFAVNGATFLNEGAAIQRSCDVQHNACANAANSGQIAGGSAQCETQNSACKAANPAKKVRRTSSKARRAALDTGSCGSPAIKFAVGLDGRKDASFEAVNQADFNHGSALNIKVISDFICGQLQSKCKASAATVASCKSASSAAQAAAGGKAQASADAFNAALGV